MKPGGNHSAGPAGRSCCRYPQTAVIAALGIIYGTLRTARAIIGPDESNGLVAFPALRPMACWRGGYRLSDH